MIPPWLVDVIAAIGAALTAMWAWFATEAGPFAALAAVVTAVIAVVALNSTARDSRARSRPVILAMFRMAENNDTAFDLVVRNYGQSAARDIEVTFSPPFGDEERSEDLTNTLAKRYDKRIPLLPPGAEVLNIWWTGRFQQGEKELVNGLKTPDQVTVTITYKGNRLRRYTETIPLDADWMKLGTRSESSTSMPGRMKQISEALKTIAGESTASRKALRDIAKSIEDEDPEADAPA